MLNVWGIEHYAHIVFLKDRSNGNLLFWRDHSFSRNIALYNSALFITK